MCKDDFAKQINKAVFPGTQGGPLMHVIAAKAVCFKEALSEGFRSYQKQILKNASCLAAELQKQGLDIVSGGTDNHLMLVDLTKLDITGKQAEQWLDEVGITVNKNTIPFETRSPFVTSGIRLGTAAVTSRGMAEDDMAQIAELIWLVLKDFETNASEVKKRVSLLCKNHPLYEKAEN